MAKEVAKRASGGAVAAAQQLRASLKTAVQAMPEAGGSQYLRFLQDGNWVFGAENHELSKGKDELAVNPFSLRLGWQCWTDYDEGKKNDLIEEITVPLGQTPPLKHELKDHGWPWAELAQVDVRVLSGKHKGKQISYSTTSKGGVSLIRSLMEQILVQLDEDEENVVPVIIVDSDHYQHKKWGRTYTPEYEIIDFVTMDGVAPEEGEEAAEEEEEEQPRRQTKKADAGKPARNRKAKTEEAEEEEEQEEAAPKPRRRTAKAEEAEEAEIVEEEEEQEEAAPRRRRRR